MAQPDLNTPNAVGPIRNRDARRVCSLSSIATAQGSLVTFRELRKGLDIAIAELEKQRSKEKIVNNALLVVRFTKATCDAFLGLAATAAKSFLPEPVSKQAELVEKVYGTVTPLAEAAATKMAGGKVDLVSTVAASVNSGVGLVTKNTGYDILTKSTVAKAEIINSAMNQDPKGIMKTATSYVYDLHTTMADIGGAKKTAAFGEIAKKTFDYNEKLGTAFDEAIQNDWESTERYLSLKRTIANQAKRISASIQELEEFISSCANEIEDQKPPALQPLASRTPAANYKS